MPIEQLFPTPIFIDIINNNDFVQVQQEIKTAISTIDQASLKNPWDDNVRTTFEHGKKRDFISSTPIFKQILRSKAIEYLRELRKPLPVTDINIVDSWVNFTGKGEYQNYHNHPLSDISGVYYYQSSLEDGDIKFKSPSSALNFSMLTANNHVSHKPLVGKLLLFPSYLEHAVMVNKTDNIRISISFNIRLVYAE